MGLSSLLECWETGLRVFLKRPWFWLWMGLVSSLCWFGFPFGLAWLKTLTTSGRADFDLVTPGFLAQSIFVAATQWSCAAGMARLAQQQLKDPHVRAVKWIEGFFGGFVTFPAAALAAFVYQESIKVVSPLDGPAAYGVLGMVLLVIFVPLHEAYIAAVAEKGTLLQIITRMARNLRPSNLPGLFGMGGIVLTLAAFIGFLILMAGTVLVFRSNIGGTLAPFSLGVILLSAPLMAIYSLAWARFWQKTASVVPAVKDASP